MMLPNGILRWLGFDRADVAVGIHLTPEYLTVAALRPGPDRLVAIGRDIVFDAAVLDDEARLVRSLAQDLRELVARLDISAGAVAVATVEPATMSVSIRKTDDDPEPFCEVDRRAHDRMAAVVRLAGLTLVRIDIVPVALARLARLMSDAPIVLRSQSRWTISTGPGYVDAAWGEHVDGDDLLVGPDTNTLREEKKLRGLRIGGDLAAVLSPGHDAPAIGAALAALGHRPLVMAHPVLAGSPRQPTQAEGTPESRPGDLPPR